MSQLNIEGMTANRAIDLQSGSQEKAIPMEFADAPRFKLEGIDLKSTFNLQSFSAQGSYSVNGANLIIVDHTDSDYNKLINHPSIENVELVGNRKISDFGVGTAANADILSLFK